MRAARVTIAGLMGAVLVVSLSLAALRSDSWAWSGATGLATCALIGLAAVGAACRTGSERAGWLGFAVLGGGYLALISIAPDLGSFPTTKLLEWSRPWVLGSPAQQAARGFFGSGMGGGGGFGGSVYTGLFGGIAGPYTEVGHRPISLLLATVGGLVAHFLFGTPAGEATSRGLATIPRPRAKAPGFLQPASSGE